MGNQKKLLSDFVLDSDCSKKRKKKVELLKFFRLMIDAKIKKWSSNDFYVLSCMKD